MLSVFPGLLFLAPLATALIRVAAGLALVYMAYRYSFERGQIERATFWPVGHIPEWLTLLGSFIVLAAGVLLVVGLYTQAVAIVGMIVAFKDIAFARRYPRIMPLSSGAAAFLFVICLSLLFSGAGAFAFDLPL